VLLRLSEVDGVILVGRAGVSGRDRVRAASHVLTQSGRRVFGLVVTDTKLPTAGGYYYDEPSQSQSSQRPGRVSSPA
jgi:Mrp family chromosome partitioning ATPase